MAKPPHTILQQYNIGPLALFEQGEVFISGLRHSGVALGARFVSGTRLLKTARLFIIVY